MPTYRQYPMIEKSASWGEIVSMFTAKYWWLFLEPLMAHSSGVVMEERTFTDEVRRRRLLRLLGDTQSVWKDKNHPELAEGSEAWVRRMRDQDERIDRERRSGCEQLSPKTTL
jgi:hypothetical protein